MNIKHVIALSVLAFAANVAWAEGSTYEYPQKIVSTQTRAEMVAAARNSPSAVQNFGEIVVAATPTRVGEPRQREEVRAEARREVRTHEVVARLLP